MGCPRHRPGGTVVEGTGEGTTLEVEKLAVAVAAAAAHEVRAAGRAARSLRKKLPLADTFRRAVDERTLELTQRRALYASTGRLPDWERRRAGYHQDIAMTDRLVADVSTQVQDMECVTAAWRPFVLLPDHGTSERVAFPTAIAYRWAESHGESASTALGDLRRALPTIST